MEQQKKLKIFILEDSPLRIQNFSDMFITDDMIISKIRIFDVLGRIVKESNFKNRINIERLSTGLHFLIIETNEGTIHKRLLKQ